MVTRTVQAATIAGREKHRGLLHLPTTPCRPSSSTTAREAERDLSKIKIRLPDLSPVPYTHTHTLKIPPAKAFSAPKTKSPQYHGLRGPTQSGPHLPVPPPILPPLQPPRSPGSSANTPSLFPPQGLCTCCSLCLNALPPDLPTTAFSSSRRAFPEPLITPSALSLLLHEPA